MIPPPPASFPDIKPYVIKVGTALHRNHVRTYRSTAFNPGVGQPSRFAPFVGEDGRTVPTLYAATSREAAAFETIFHDIEPGASFKTVRLSVVKARAASHISPRRDLRLVPLFAPDLHVLKVRRGELIDTPRSTYAATVAWAQSMHRACPGRDGLVWTSRQCDPERCMVLFGDRVSEDELLEVDRRDAATDPDLLLELRFYGRRAGIDLVN